MFISRGMFASTASIFTRDTTTLKPDTVGFCNTTRVFGVYGKNFT